MQYMHIIGYPKINQKIKINTKQFMASVVVNT